MCNYLNDFGLINYHNDYCEVVRAFACSRCNFSNSTFNNFSNSTFNNFISNSHIHIMLNKIIIYIQEEINPPDFIRIESGIDIDILSHISVGLSNMLRKEIINNQQPPCTENERLLRLGLNNHLINQLNIVPIFKIDSDTENTCDCSICLEDDLKEFVTLNCSHKFCKNCFNNHLSHTQLSTSKCALCRETILSIIIYEDSK